MWGFERMNSDEVCAGHYETLHDANKILSNRKTYKFERKHDLYCSSCEIELKDWIYYEYNNIKICHFCYKMLTKKNEEE